MDNMEFREKQEESYNKNRDTALLRKEGIKRSFPDQGGYLIILRHPIEVTEPIERFTSRIANTAPCIPYGSHNLHTTISDYELTPLSEFNPEL